MVLQRSVSRVALTLALALVATTMFTALRTAPSAQAATVTTHWYGVSVNLSWSETHYLGSAAGVGACTYIAARVPHPLAKAAVAVACWTLKPWAQYAYRYGYCLSFKVTRYPTTAFPWVRRC